MNSQSDKPLSLEELKQRNRPASMSATPPPTQHPTEEEWNALLHKVDKLLRRTQAQEAVLRTLTERSGVCPSRKQIEALARDVAALREMLQPDGSESEPEYSPPRFQLPMVDFAPFDWRMAVMTLMAVIALGSLLYALAIIWNIFSPILS